MPSTCSHPCFPNPPYATFDSLPCQLNHYRVVFTVHCYNNRSHQTSLCTIYKSHTIKRLIYQSHMVIVCCYTSHNFTVNTLHFQLTLLLHCHVLLLHRQQNHSTSISCCCYSSNIPYAHVYYNSLSCYSTIESLHCTSMCLLLFSRL